MDNTSVKDEFINDIENDNYGVRARQLELLAMLKEVDAFFSENGIKYSLFSGTLLGAVRHDGFIPWDDDVDIVVDRNNYNKLLKLFEDKANSTRFVVNRILWINRIQDRNDDSGSLTTPTIDIFVFDNCPDNGFVRKLKLLLIKCLQGMMKTEKTTASVSAFYKLCLVFTRVIGKLFTQRFKFRMYDRVARIGNKKVSRYLGSYFSTFNCLHLQYSNTLMKEMTEHKFEDTVMPITAEYDSYLTTVYGDYMTPPKKEDRISQHI